MLLARPPRMCCGGENKHRWSIVMVNDVEVYVHSEQWVVVVSFEQCGAAAHETWNDRWWIK